MKGCGRKNQQMNIHGFILELKLYRVCDDRKIKLKIYLGFIV